MQKVERPKADKKKIHCKNEFELCYLRHQYLRKVDFNPTEADMAPYDKLVTHLAKNTFFTYRNIFGPVGMECDDIVNIAKVHLVSFLGLFALERNQEKMDQFLYNFAVNRHQDAGPEDILNKNKANLTVFIKQRMEDVVRVCRQKVRNIRGFPGDEFYIYVGPTAPPENLEDLIEDHGKYGFRKLDIALFKTIRKRAKAKRENTFQYEGQWYVSVHPEHKSLDISDFRGADMDPYDSLHYMTPEQIYFDKKEGQFWEEKRVEFDSYGPRKRVNMLSKFIEENKNDARWKEEVKLAKRLLKTLGA